jgi:hypothetical protein
MPPQKSLGAGGMAQVLESLFSKLLEALNSKKKKKEKERKKGGKEERKKDPNRITTTTTTGHLREVTKIYYYYFGLSISFYSFPNFCFIYFEAML